MTIKYRKSFLKQFDWLQLRHQEAVNDAIALFNQDPFARALDNHSLKCTQKGRRAISVGFDLRIIFEERDHYTVVLMVAVGTHNQVY